MVSVKRETQKTITDWSLCTFGPTSDETVLFNRFIEEVLELKAEIQARVFPHNRDRIQSELADCYILLAQMAQQYNIDLHEAVDTKMAVNRQRKWVMDGNGVGRHVKEVE